MRRIDKIRALSKTFETNSSKSLIDLISEPLVCIHNLSEDTISIPDILNRKMVKIPCSEYLNMPTIQGRKVEIKINLGKGIRPNEKNGKIKVT